MNDREVSRILAKKVMEWFLDEIYSNWVDEEGRLMCALWDWDPPNNISQAMKCLKKLLDVEPEAYPCYLYELRDVGPYMDKCIIIKDNTMDTESFEAEADTPARAIVCAILKAIGEGSRYLNG